MALEMKSKDDWVRHISLFLPLLTQNPRYCSYSHDLNRMWTWWMQGPQAKSSYRCIDEVSMNSENSASDVTSYSGLCSEGRPICIEPKSIDSSISSPLESKVSSINSESKDSSAGVGT